MACAGVLGQTTRAPGRFAGALYTRGKRFITRYFVACTERASRDERQRRREVRIAMFKVSVVRLVCLIWAIAVPITAFAQAQAANGNIEGTVRDVTGAVVPGVTVTVLNTDLGTSRVVVTNYQGFYRAPLLPLGVYTLKADMQGFRRNEQRGLTLSAGQTIVANIQLEVGGFQVSPVDVSSVVSAAQAGRIDLGRTINEDEIRNLPLVSRNPYNFAFLQANVTGY